MSRSVRQYVWLVATVGIVTSAGCRGCGKKDQAVVKTTPCASSSDCAKSDVCDPDKKICIASCSGDSDCTIAGQSCVSGMCQTTTVSVARCTTDSDCTTGLSCQNLVCQPQLAAAVCKACTPGPDDTDGDCEPNDKELLIGTDPNNPDSDGDGISDGCEDRDHNGVVGQFPPELDPTKADTDGDGLPDGVEDANHNGVYDASAGETNGTNADTDADGIRDGDEDRNHDGLWNCSIKNSDGSFTVIPGDPCEMNPRLLDTDGDGLPDNVELRSSTDPKIYFLNPTDQPDSHCNAYGKAVVTIADVAPGLPAGDVAHDWNEVGHSPDRYIGKDGVRGRNLSGVNDDQTCPWNADSDEDGIKDGKENKSATGVVELGESDPRLADSDRDGVPDGLEDLNQDGLYDIVTETNPALSDTDGDKILDGVEDSGGCIINHAPGSEIFICHQPTNAAPKGLACNCDNWENGKKEPNESDPRLLDTDGDGIGDGIEDANGDGYCTLALDHVAPKPSDESCAWADHSDSDSLSDGGEDINGNGKLDPGETDPRYGDPDNDCLDDAYEKNSALDPFNPDSDGDGLPDGLEASHIVYHALTSSCDPVGGTTPPPACSASVTTGCSYSTTTCTNPHVKDSDGDGLVDGVEVVAGQTLGEDVDADGIVGPGESNPCSGASPGLPQIAPIPTGDGTTVAGVCVDTSCTGYTLSGPGVDPKFVLPVGPPVGTFPADCADPAACASAYKTTLELVCTDGSIKPIIEIKSSVNDYTLAMPGVRDNNHVTQKLYTTQDLTFGTNPIGTDFISNDALSSTLESPFRAVFGSIVRMGTVQPGQSGNCDQVTDSPPILDLVLPQPAASGACPPTQNYVIPNSQPSPSDVAERTYGRLIVTLNSLGYTVKTRTAGGDFFAHDDQSTSGLPSAITVQGATDSYTIGRSAGGTVDPVEIKRGVLAALTGGNQIANQLTPAAGYATGSVGILKIEFYRRAVKARKTADNGSTTLVNATEYGAIFAVSPVDRDCSEVSSTERVKCKLEEEQANIPTDDLTNGSAVGRFDAIFGTGCEPFDPAKSKADFLVVVDDSVSMQGYILAIQAAARDVSGRLSANQANLDWRIGLTTSNMGRDDDQRALSALDDPYDYQGAYNKLTTTPDGIAIYQSSAFDANGQPARCHYSDTFNVLDPLGSPYCCAAPTSDDDTTFIHDCCSYGGSTAPYPATLTEAAGANTLGCYDYPRYDAAGDVWHVTNYSPDGSQPQSNFLDYLCGNGDFYGNTYNFSNIWGARGHLFPPGFVGPALTNPRLDGANLLIRNADMLVTQMNRPCAFGKYTPRSIHGSQFEHPQQATKRAIERAVGAGRLPSPTSTPALGDPIMHRLRQDAPVFSIVLSDEEDYALKYVNNASGAPSAVRDQNSLPLARCYSNPSDDGCTVNYCESCFEGVAGQNYVEGTTRVPSYSKRIPAARLPSGAPSTAGAYCQSPDISSSASNIMNSARYDGFYELYPASTDGLHPDLESNGNAYSDPNSVAHDWLNLNNGAPVTCNSACGSDCQPCMRFLREKQYTDFFGGQCSQPVGAAASNDTRQYPKPFLTLPSGDKIELPLGKNYAITRRAGFQGGVAGSCGSTYAGGDGLAHRDISLASGGRVADICLADTFVPATGAGGFTDFLDEIVVDAQGVGSPYRLQGDPISSTIQVGVIAKDGKLYLLKRSSVSGFDYNPTSRSIAFFTEGLTSDKIGFFGDNLNRVNNWDKVVISYRVWDRQCPTECALGDVCGVCACSAASPECCTTKPTFECRSAAGCLHPCGACETCDNVTSTCRAVDPCARGDANFKGCGINMQCDRSTGTCVSCAAGTTPIKIGCEGDCTENQQYVCVSTAGIASGSGASCRSDTSGSPPGPDCCGSDKTCAAGTACVLSGCSGEESCIPTAHCLGTANACGTCPSGTSCSPLPCADPTNGGGEGNGTATASCPALFACTSDGNPAQCAHTQQCGCPDGQFCNDCGPCKTCNGGQCNFIAACGTGSGGGEETLADCASKAAAQCCPPGEVYDSSTQSCQVSGDCNPACPTGFFCAAGQCFKNGG